VHITFDTRPNGNIEWTDFSGSVNVRNGEVVRLNTTKYSREDGSEKSLGITYVVRDEYRGGYVPNKASGKSVRVEIVLDDKMVAVLANALNKYVISNGEESLPFPLIEFERFDSFVSREDPVSLPLELELSLRPE
jgi:hypothetical protein